jgi:glycosyltransferase involved in cell wall biosynthesis
MRPPSSPTSGGFDAPAGGIRAAAPSTRLGVYVDDVYRVIQSENGEQISVDRAFLLFACEVGRHFERLVLFGRTVRSSTSADYILPPETELAELPHYSNLRHISEVVAASAGTVRGMWRGLSRVDCVWVQGPHPFAVLLVALATVRRKRVVLGVRMESVQYYRSRLPSRRWAPALAPIVAIDRVYRLLSRRFATTVVGADLARRYGGERPSLLTMAVSLVRERDLITTLPAPRRTETVELLTVGRLEPEKNPLLLIEALHTLERETPGRYLLTWVGRGELEQAVRERALELGIDERVRLLGYVPFGPELLALYRHAHAFVHVSRTEGVPQVLIEALASGAPIVATDVGGVRELLDDGRAGILVPPDDLDALVAALRRVAEEGPRTALATRGLEVARELTLEREAERVARFLATG